MRALLEAQQLVGTGRQPAHRPAARQRRLKGSALAGLVLAPVSTLAPPKRFARRRCGRRGGAPARTGGGGYQAALPAVHRCAPMRAAPRARSAVCSSLPYACSAVGNHPAYAYNDRARYVMAMLAACTRAFCVPHPHDPSAPDAQAAWWLAAAASPSLPPRLPWSRTPCEPPRATARC